tara:strand:+ start:214 stop:660 length:447 start_codon:yes stop_codon:yes gene_type:complete
MASPLTINQIIHTQPMSIQELSTTHEYEPMDVAPTTPQWKPRLPHTLPLLTNHVIHIQRNGDLPVLYGRLIKFDTNMTHDSYFVIFDLHPHAMHRHTICTRLIRSVYIDHTPTTHHNLQTLYYPLIYTLNTDVVQEIYSYLQTDFIYL